MQFLLLQQKKQIQGKGKDLLFTIIYYYFLKREIDNYVLSLSKFLFLLSCIIIDKFYELYLTFSCFFLVCFVKNYGIKNATLNNIAFLNCFNILVLILHTYLCIVLRFVAKKHLYSYHEQPFHPNIFYFQNKVF